MRVLLEWYVAQHAYATLENIWNEKLSRNTRGIRISEQHQADL
jgi:hypothetical protein